MLPRLHFKQSFRIFLLAVLNKTALRLLILSSFIDNVMGVQSLLNGIGFIELSHVMKLLQERFHCVKKADVAYYLPDCYFKKSYYFQILSYPCMSTLGRFTFTILAEV